MRRKSRSNALFIELLIVVAFFLLDAAFLIPFFSAAGEQERKAQAVNQALIDGQNLAEMLYGEDHPDELLTRLGFSGGDGVWYLEGTLSGKEQNPGKESADGRQESTQRIEVTITLEDTEAGLLHRYQVLVRREEEELLTLPVVWYQEGQS